MIGYDDYLYDVVKEKIKKQEKLLKEQELLLEKQEKLIKSQLDKVIFLKRK